MAHNLLPQTIQLMDVFEAFDQDGDHSLSLQEFSKALKSLKPDLTEWLIGKIFRRIDRNQDGHIQLEEFMVAACDKKFIINKEVQL
jgi:Ca2+-binding EF-hand superfamily protein